MAFHLCHVFPGFGPGGSQVRTAAVINGLGSAYRHTIISIQGSTASSALIDGAIEVDYVSSERGRWGAFYPLYLGRKIRRLRPDLLFTYNWGAMDAGMGAVLRRVRPWVQVMDGFETAEADRQHPRRVFLRRFFYKRCAGLVAVSNVLADIATRQWRIPSDRVLHIPNGIDTERFSPGSGEAVRRQLGLAPTDLLVGCVAHIRTEKNPAALLRAFARVKAPAHLAYVGEIPDEGHYHREAYDEIVAGIGELGLSGRVHFSGEIDDPVPWYRALDVFALSSNTEQMPLSVAEAMACGKPVISTDVGDVFRMVADENRAYVLAKGDEAAYATALERLLADGDTRARLGDANLEKARREFPVARMIEDYRTLCARLIN